MPSFRLAGRGRPFPEPDARPSYAPDRGCRVTALDVGLTIDPDSPGIVGDTWVELAPLPSGTLEAVLDLGDVTVDGVEDDGGKALSFAHDGETLRIHGVPASGGRVRVRYHGSPDRGIYFTGPTRAEPGRLPMAWTQCQDRDGHHLFPCHDHPGQRTPIKLRITAKAPLVVVGNGVLEEVVDHDDGTRTWVWLEPDPIPAYLVVVCVGAFDILEDAALDGDLPLRYIVPAGTDLELAEAVFDKTAAMVDHFSSVFGTRYPWARYDQVVVHDFIFGGMENAAATVLTDRVLTDAPVREAGGRKDDLIAHELAHQWFGDLVTCADWSQAWLNEGWATYSEVVWKRADAGEDEALLHLWGQLEGYLAEDGGRYRRPITQFRWKNPIDLFDRHLYEKGSLVLHTLRAVLGDAVFWQAVATYLERFALKPVHTRDFQGVMEETSGRNLDGFFETFVHGAGHPELKVSAAHSNGLLTVSVEQTQSGPEVADIFSVPLRLRLVWDDREQWITLPLTERARSFAIPVETAPVTVEIDPELDILAVLSLKLPVSWHTHTLAHSPHVIARLRAARALGKNKGRAAVAALCRAVQSEGAWGVTGEAARQLAKVGGPVAREALLAASRRSDPKIRRGVVAALQAVRSPDVITRLEEIVHSADPSPFVLAAAIEGLGKLRADNALGRLTAVLESEQAAAAAGRGTWDELLRSAALDGLGATRDPLALPVLLAHSTDAHVPSVRCAAARGLGQLAEEVPAVRRDAVDRLIELVRGDAFRVSLTTLGALGRCRDARAIAPLRELHAGSPSGIIARRAWEAAERLAKAVAGPGEHVSALRDEVTKLRADNKNLRARLEKLEALVAKHIV